MDGDCQRKVSRGGRIHAHRCGRVARVSRKDTPFEIMLPEQILSTRIGIECIRFSGERCRPESSIVGLGPDPESDHSDNHDRPHPDHPPHLDDLLVLQIEGELGDLKFERGRELFEGQRRLGESLLHLRVEAREVEGIELSQIGSVRSVHLIEPVYPLVGRLVAETVGEGPGGPRLKPRLGCSLRSELADTIQGTLGRP